VVALGETGLDYHRLPSKAAAKEAAKKGAPTGQSLSTSDFSEQDKRYKEKQTELFRQHMEVAAELGLNCVIHQREAQEDTLSQLAPFSKRVRGVFHCFADDSAILRRVLELGSLVSFTGILTFKNGQNIRDALAAAPMDAFMLETDCPFLAPAPYRGKRCEPAYVKEISQLAAEVKKCSLDDLSAATCATAEKFFQKLS
jgi:TatD DNase family protein